MNNPTPDDTNGGFVDFFARVIHSDATKRGIAGAIAGVVVAAITEGLWPTRA